MAATTSRPLNLSPVEALANSLSRHGFVQPQSSISAIASDVVGLHNTSPVGPYLSLRARIGDFSRDDLDVIMFQKWELARLRAMRTTMFVMPHEILEIAGAATRHLIDTLTDRWLHETGMERDEYAGLADAVDAALTDGPMTVRELRTELQIPAAINLPGVVGRMCDEGRLVGGAPPRSWRSPVRRYHRWRDVLPEVDLTRHSQTSAMAELVRRYVDAYGPVTLDDVAWWTGITKGRCRLALESIELEEVDVEGWPGPMFRLAGAVPPPAAESMVRALPALDPYVQGYRDRERMIEPEWFDYVYDGGGNSAATLVHRGRIIGVWQTSEEPVSSVRYHFFAAQPEPVRSAAWADLAAAGRMFFDEEVEVVEVPEMTSLRAGGRSAMHPLDGRQHRASRFEG